MRDSENVKLAGIHLAGPNSLKTTVVMMTGFLGEGNLKIASVYDRLGPAYKLFSDERLFELLQHERPDRVMVDCPLTLPPCVACTRPSCPGVIACEDIAVSYMQKLLESSVGRRRKRPLNPQTQRVWDVEAWFEQSPHIQEPSYSANKAPLVVRARTLQRRLNSLSPPLVLHETSIPHVLLALCEQWGLPFKLGLEYRTFEEGEKRREEWLRQFQNRGLLSQDLRPSDLLLLTRELEVFSAWISGMMAYWHAAGHAPEASNPFYAEQGWVYLPVLPSAKAL
jgi:hypothetical protein